MSLLNVVLRKLFMYILNCPNVIYSKWYYFSTYLLNFEDFVLCSAPFCINFTTRLSDFIEKERMVSKSNC